MKSITIILLFVSSFCFSQSAEDVVLSEEYWIEWAKVNMNRSEVKAQNFDPVKIGKEIWKVVNKYRMTNNERAIYNVGVKALNEFIDEDIFDKK